MEKWQDPQTLALWLGIIIFILVGLASSIVLFTRLYFKRILRSEQTLNEERVQHQSKLAENGILILERERQRVSLELHDSLVSSLNTALLSMSANKEFQPLLSECIRETRRISHDLSPPMIGETTLATLVEEYLSPLMNKYTIRTYITNTRAADFNKSLKVHVLRVFQECLNNVIKHSSSTTITLQLRITSTYLVLKLSDNGIGYDVSESKSGLGLQNIALRVQILKGRYRIQSKPEEGTSVLIFIPNLSQNEESI